jgi:hypothetical protein
LRFFTNPLIIPQDWGTAQFDAKSAVEPILRATNGGFLFVTMEIDCQSRDEFEENLGWTRGKRDDFNQSPFAAVDRRLCQFRDYRGHSVVLSGNKSLHFHFLFSTKHLGNCPEKTVDEELGDWGLRAALIGKAHTVYWERVREIFLETLQSSEPDIKLRSITQWRRIPWGLRSLEKDSSILELPTGTAFPRS